MHYVPKVPCTIDGIRVVHYVKCIVIFTTQTRTNDIKKRHLDLRIHCSCCFWILRIMETSKRRLSTLRRHLTTNSTLPFNPKQVLEKYNFERDARLNNRPEGVAQYQHISELAEKDERFNSMLIDPWTNIEPRETKHDHVEVAIIGAGYGGLLAGAHLVKQGIPSSSIRIIDTILSILIIIILYS